ncbi:hypothetical protein KKA17_08130 [bacterium]|nr:hypothetical protein [bacterium]
MKYLLILLSLFYSLYADTVEMPLSRFAGLVASSHHINILVDDTIDSNNVLFYIESSDKSVFMLDSFRQLLNKNGFDLSFNEHGKYYFVSKIPDVLKSPHYIELQYPVIDDLKSSLIMLDVNYTYNPNTNMLLFMGDNDDSFVVKQLIKKNDLPIKQFILKINIIETNLNEVKSHGVDLSAYAQSLQGSAQSFLGLLTSFSSSSINVFSSSDVGVSATLKFLNDNAFTNILSSPFFTVENNKKISFSSVDNVPYKTSNVTTDSSVTSSNVSYTYKDVGLKINLLPHVVGDVVYVDMGLINESLTDKTSDTPTTSKRELNNSFHLVKGEVLVLGGL